MNDDNESDEFRRRRIDSNLIMVEGESSKFVESKISPIKTRA